ncbi:MAG TPA: hypothetical protein VE010_13445 [Thermoanaerobaculia bacterium]|nr:hypothetical protein [Thermoanaerobaculia bacterium]
MLATEEQTHVPSLETQARNERMRHIPGIPWIVQKLDGDVRRNVEKLWRPYADLPASDPRHPALEAAFRSLCKSLDRVTDIARKHRGHPHPPNELGRRLHWAIGEAIAALNSTDTETFGKRLPFHTFERSNSEPRWAAVLSVLQHVQRALQLVRDIDPTIDEQMYEGLVQLNEPLRREPMA